MDTDAVTFPALIVVEDGWVEYIDSPALLSAWTRAAIKKYNKCRVMLSDQADRAWLVESIISRPRRRAFSRLIQTIYKPRLDVQMQVRPITENPIGALHDALLLAIDNDDDALTQYSEAPLLTTAIQNATSFKAVVQALRSAHAI